MILRNHFMGRLAAAALVAAAMMGMSSIEALAATEESAAQTAEAQTEAVQIPAPTEFAHILSCGIQRGNQIAIRGQMEGTWSDPAYYDNYLYLFELKPYEDDLGSRTDYMAWITKGDDLSFDVALNLGTADDRLYSKFVVAVFDGEKYTKVSNTAYVSNPESVAKHTDVYKNAQTKKGLLIENTESMVADAFDLGVNHVIVNIPFHHILGEGINYEYDGKTYSFNKALMQTYDSTIRRMSEKNMTVTAVILNGWNDATPQLIYPGVTKQPENQVFYYGFNASTPEGYETIKAIASFLADRYSSLQSPYGKISNWIIGNEINNQQWNYVGPMGLDQYVHEYERAFRVFYTAIKSTNQNDRLFFSTDYNWLHDADGTKKYNVKDLLDRFADQSGAGGPMDWGLAYHPYSMPLTEPEFWDDDQTGLVRGDVSSPVVNLKNLNVLTDYLQTPSMLSPTGEVRNVILSEQGFTSKSATRGENNDLQAAAIAYAYYIADSNPYIDAFIMSRQVDAPQEVNSSLQFGLWYCDMNQPNAIVPTMRKKSWVIYKNIDNKKTTLETTEFAKALIGISKWSDVIPNFRWRSQE
ncbi:MAG: DUF5722 domain-containing protein [Lachnospiraceae bacterium]|nr:DUF5722 domain-containing protein [Lachnospiraceae bacterium]